MPKQKAVFFDRDGTLIRYIKEPIKPAHILLVKDAAWVTRKLSEAGFLSIVITNQPVVGKGLITKKEADQLNKLLVLKIKHKGGKIDAVYMCPHRYKPKNGCACRKPGVKLIEYAKKKFNLDLKKSFVVGDTNRDVQTGINARIKTVLLRGGKKDKEKNFFPAKPNFQANSIRQVLEIVKRNA